MSNITFYIGDERPNLSGVITFTGSPDLSGATVTLTATTKDGTEAVSDDSVTITIDNSEKTIDWSYSDATFTVIGTYYVYLTVTFSGGDVQSIPISDKIIVKQPYG